MSVLRHVRVPGMSGLWPPRGPKPARWTFAGAALVILQLSVTGAQLLACTVFATFDDLAQSWASGTLLALAAALAVGATSRTWTDVRRMTPVWAAVTAVIAFSMAGYAASRQATRLASIPVPAVAVPAAELRPSAE